MKVSRTSRLNGEYQKEISEILRRLKDRAEVKGIVSVTEADVAPDLKTAKIYVSIYASSEQEKEATFATIKNHAGYIRKELSKVMSMRTVPALSFILDGSMTYGSKMDELFKQIAKQPKSDDTTSPTDEN